MSGLAALGWSDFFARQLSGSEAAAQPLRIATVHRARMTARAPEGTLRVQLDKGARTHDFAVGDWILADADHRMIRRLERRTVLQRKTDGSTRPQLIAANVDTLFIVTSCNEDFNPARLERYLALAAGAGTTPVIVLTKADKTEGAEKFESDARSLQRDLDVVSLNAKSPGAAQRLARWCGTGQTAALIGSSGVGKSTLLNTLTGSALQATGSIREDDAKGRHTTTARALHPIAGGGIIIDTPGIRTLHLAHLEDGLGTVFAEIAERADDCRFRDCTHLHEPGCAVQAAIAQGQITAERFERWHKLHSENAGNTPDPGGPKAPQGRGRRR